MTFVLVLAVVIQGSPALFPYSPAGDIHVFPDKAACEQTLAQHKPEIDKKIVQPHKLACVSKKEWDAIPAQWEDKDLPPVFRNGV